VTSPDTAPIVRTESQGATRRSRKAMNFTLGALALVALLVTTTGCSPEIIAKDAIAKHWGRNAACAERIVDRESNFQAAAVNSRSGATGLFQMMPLHATWIKAELGYDFSEMKDPYKNAEAAKLLSYKNYKAYGDGWAPWRLTGRAVKGGGCPA
jgi:soluble lytic murein transglycosylase-like protein